MALSFEGKTIWITGASSGIGKACAAAFARHKSALILSSRDEHALRLAADQCGTLGAQDVLVLPLDVTRQPMIEHAVRTAEAWRSRIDVLFLNAGVSQRSEVIDTHLDVYRMLMEVNFFGPVALTRLVLPAMIAAGGGHIAVTSSVAGKLGAPSIAGYSASKHALHGFFDSLRAELWNKKISVTMITPGFVETNVGRNAVGFDGQPVGHQADPAKRRVSADAAAKIIVAQLARGRQEFALGGYLELSALWLKRLAPTLLSELTKRRTGV